MVLKLKIVKASLKATDRTQKEIKKGQKRKQRNENKQEMYFRERVNCTFIMNYLFQNKTVRYWYQLPYPAAGHDT